MWKLVDKAKISVEGEPEPNREDRELLLNSRQFVK